MIGAMAGACLEESWVSLPHGQTTGGSTRPTALRPEPQGQSLRASLSDLAPRLEPEASLQILAPLGTGGVSTGFSTALFVCLFTLLDDILTFAATCTRCSQSWC
jgi:hypothetical protein